MRDYLRKNCEQSLYLNPFYHFENKFKTEAFWFVFKSICYNICTNFPKIFWWGGETEKSRFFRTQNGMASELHQKQSLMHSVTSGFTIRL